MDDITGRRDSGIVLDNQDQRDDITSRRDSEVVKDFSGQWRGWIGEQPQQDG